jgi:hypothetical protein
LQGIRSHALCATPHHAGTDRACWGCGPGAKPHTCPLRCGLVRALHQSAHSCASAAQRTLHDAHGGGCIVRCGVQWQRERGLDGGRMINECARGECTRRSRGRQQSLGGYTRRVEGVVEFAPRTEWEVWDADGRSRARGGIGPAPARTICMRCSCFAASDSLWNDRSASRLAEESTHELFSD